MPSYLIYQRPPMTVGERPPVERLIAAAIVDADSEEEAIQAAADTRMFSEAPVTVSDPKGSVFDIKIEYTVEEARKPKTKEET